jgi:hypothetical protein
VTVYVDDMRLPARVGRLRARWSHLITDNPDLDELHRFAASIGLRRSWFQDDRLSPGDQGRPHYDVTDSKRRQALAAGAVPILAAETLEIIRRRRAELAGIDNEKGQNRA